MVIGVLLHMVGAVMMVRFRSLDTSTFVIVASQVMGGLGGECCSEGRYGLV